MQLGRLGKTGQPVTRLGLGLAALGRPGYINLGHADDLGRDYDRAGRFGGEEFVLLLAQTSESDLTPMVPLLAAPGHSGVSLTADIRAATRAERRRWRETASGSLDDHLMNNRRGYRFRRVGEYGGWNGPYVSAEIKGDPWGRQFLVNSRWLDGASSAADAQGRLRPDALHDVLAWGGFSARLGALGSLSGEHMQLVNARRTITIAGEPAQMRRRDATWS